MLLPSCEVTFRIMIFNHTSSFHCIHEMISRKRFLLHLLLYLNLDEYRKYVFDIIYTGYFIQKKSDSTCSLLCCPNWFAIPEKVLHLKHIQKMKILFYLLYQIFDLSFLVQHFTSSVFRKKRRQVFTVVLSPCAVITH
jgi:hypothetical protein